GFIGSHICQRLLKEGAEVVVLDDFSTGKLTNLEHIKEDLKIFKGRIENYNDVSEAIKGCNIVIHEAFPYGKSGMGLEEQYIEDGVIGTFNVLKASVKNDVEKVVNASSVAVYGIPKYLPINEKHPINPFLPYGATKYVGELYCKTFSKLYGLDTASLRYFYVYGARYAQFDHSAMVNFLNRSLEDKPLLIYGDGSQIRDYTYIDDAVEGTLLAAMKENTLGATYNISYGEGVTISELAKKVAKIVDKDVEIRFAEAREYRYSDEYCIVPVGLTKKLDDKWVDERIYVGDISKAKKELNYNPKVRIEEGIKRTVEWLKSLKGIEI
ncbi:GDP-mannose 4,6-dehydratase, partial [Dehalococcoidia bacterium]|nr:GDP-mannose 4,6-dehydratase [Dehalococcoidia bacterium]